MSKERRVQTILTFLAERRVAMPPKVLYDNLVIYEDVTFSYRTVKRLLGELREEGRVEYLDRGNGYYRVSADGREVLDGD